MIATWMLYSILLGAAIGLFSYAIERLTSYAVLSTRWVWICAILVSAGAPFILPLVSPTLSLELVSSVGPPTLTQPEIGAAGPLVSTPNTDAAITGARVLDLALIGAWAVASLAMIGLLFASSLGMARAKRRWRAAEVAGERIHLSGRTGPGVVGFLRSTIVIPEWVLDWDEQRQRMIVLHEREHAAARDPFLLLVACLSLALVPWNLAMWWQLRRLRLAVEVDCDRRVLRRSGDVVGYGELLLEVGQRASRSWYAVAAFSEPRSFLERRIRRIILGRTKMTKRQGFMIGAILLATPIGLLATPIPQQSPLQRLGELALLNDQPTSERGVAGDIGSQSPIERETMRSVVVAATVPPTTVQPSSVDDPAILPVVDGSLVPPSPTGSDEQQQQQQARDTVYRLSDLNRNPELRNAQAMAPIMERLYPRELQDLGLGGTVLMEFVIGRDGVADSSSVRVLETPWANLGEASIYAVKAFQFRPGMIDGQPVPVLIQMPIAWRPRERAAQP